MIQCKCGITYGTSTEYYIECVCGEVLTGKTTIVVSGISPWNPLHQYPALHQHNWIVADVIKWYWEQFVPTIPCGFCTDHWFSWVEKNPLEEAVQSPSMFFEWGWRGHNWVSENQSHKPTLTLKEALSIWWPDSVNTIKKKDVK